MGYQRAHHKKKGKFEKSQIAHIKPFFQVNGKPTEKFYEILRYWSAMDRVRCCPTDTCNNGEGICDGSCKEYGRN